MRAGLWFAAALLPFAVALFGTPFMVDLNLRMCVLVMVAISFNMMAGAGLISLGHSGFWGLGSYAAILSANQLGLPFGLSLFPAMLAGMVVGAGLALITGRLRGIYFAISTLAMSEAFRVLAVMLPDLTGGSHGLYLEGRTTALTVNLVAAGGAVVAGLVALAVSRSRYQFALRAMRDNEAASQMLGVEPMRYRLGIMAISGAIASVAGGINTWRGGYLDPAVGFTLSTTVESQIAPIVGGIYTLAGPIIGSIATVALSEITRLAFGGMVGISLLVFGLVLVLVVLWMPHGVVGLFRASTLRKRPAPVGPISLRSTP